MTHSDVILTVRGHGGKHPPRIEHAAGRYLGYFENDTGEQIIFVQDRGEAHAVVYHSDMDWKPERVVGGFVAGVILDQNERNWVAACWAASQSHRQSR